MTDWMKITGTEYRRSLIMMRSLFSGVSGLKAHQTKMDIIGNNISNVNTIGFKSSSVNFSDILYQTSQNATGPNPNTGMTGRNAMQIGLGSNVASITSSIKQTGASQRTDNPFDVMIEGEGFFIVNSGGTNYFTKAGSFNVDAYGTLCTPSGAAVMGWQVDPLNPNKTLADVVSPLNIMSPENLYAEPEATTELSLSGNIDSKDTQVTSASGKVVNLSFYDNLGHGYSADLRITQTAASTDTYDVAIANIYDDDNKSIFVKETVDPATGAKTYSASDINSFTFGGISYQVTSVAADGSITMDTTNAPDLKFNGATGAFISVGDGATTGDSLSFAINATPNPFNPINIDFSGITMYSTSGLSSVEAAKGSIAGIGGGKQVGNLTGVGIDQSGKIFGKYDNGDSKLLGQIAVATFSNPSGLEAVGNSMFAETQNSGGFDGIGQDPSQGGSLSTGVLEMSNVDLSSQFTDMITTQRGFQANSRIITTSDTMLEELINLKR